MPGWTVWTHPAPGGETADEVAARLDRVVARVRGARAAGCWSSGTATRCGRSPRAGSACRSTEGRLFRLDTATVSVLGYERETPVVLRWNS